MFKLRKLGDPVLREKCNPVEQIDEELAKLVEQMVPVMKSAMGLGLAAPQVAVVKNVFIYDFGYGVRVMANPRIKWSDDEETLEEGCLSIPGINILIPRAKCVEIEGRNLRGQLISVRAEGLLARILQHEVDHLNGVLIIDRVDREKRKKALEEYRELEAQRDVAAPGERK